MTDSVLEQPNENDIVGHRERANIELPRSLEPALPDPKVRNQYEQQPCIAHGFCTPPPSVSIVPPNGTRELSGQAANESTHFAEHIGLVGDEDVVIRAMYRNHTGGR